MTKIETANNIDEGDSIIAKILDRIRVKMDSLTPRQKVLGDYVLQNYEQLAFTSINDFAQKVRVSQATIVRFCCELGYEGYLQFSRELQQAIQARLSGVNRFHLAQQRKKKNSTSIFENVISQELEHVAGLTKHINKSDFYKCMQLMHKADRICVIGCLGSSSLAIHLGQMLAKIINQVDVLTTSDIMGAATLNKLTSKSLVFIIAFPRYPRVTLQLGGSASKTGAHIVCLTNTHLSPVIPLSEITFIVPVGIPSFVDSFTAPIAFITALCTELSEQNPESARRALTEFDDYARETNIFVKPRI